MKKKITITLLGLLLLTSFSNEICWHDNPFSQKSESVITIRHFECFREKNSKTVCQESFEYAFDENSDCKITIGSRRQKVRSPDDSAGHKKIPVVPLIC
jgi:hypothetical protein